MKQVEIKNLTKVFVQGENEIYAVNHVSLTIDRGEMIAITGQSGSGKTTLLNLIGGIETPTSGTVFIEGVDIGKASSKVLADLRRKKIGYIFQDFNLIPILTVEENILLPTWLGTGREDKDRLNEILRFLELENRRNHLPSELSGGQRQRVAIARAMMNQPTLILADEPTGNLDRKMANEIINCLIELKERGITVILVTHEERYADMCDRKVVISDGCIVSYGESAKGEVHGKEV